LAFEQFHRNKHLAIFLSDLVDRADVGMIQGRGGFGLASPMPGEVQEGSEAREIETRPTLNLKRCKGTGQFSHRP
jgi:hypothetical protein